MIAAGGAYAYGAISRKMEADAFAVKRTSCTDELQKFYSDRVNSDLAAKVDNCVVLGYLAKDEVYQKLHPTFD